MRISAKTLKDRILIAVTVALCLTVAAGAVLAQTTPAPTPPAGNGHQGTVVSVDTTKNSFVITTADQGSLTIDTTSKTHITKSANIGLSGLKVGDSVTVNGQVDTSALAVSARRITVRNDAGKGGGRAGNGRSLRGTVATTSPNLTVKGDDGKTYAVTPARDNIQVLA
ncbi:MAG TPA: hypothetical protein VFW40_07050, partial [Capsulimonadaceae bacterium]|nr:hypothetical protein [Capsulimonadaceae bacterium]